MTARCTRTDCRTTLDEYPVTCPHGLTFCDHCTFEESCVECAVSEIQRRALNVHAAVQRWDLIARPA